MFKKKLLNISFFCVLVWFERICSILVLIGLTVSLLCHLEGFNWVLLLEQTGAALLSISCWKASQIDEMKLNQMIEGLRKGLINEKRKAEQK